MRERAVHVRVYGIVQGVGFRFFTQRVASVLGISGYVRNMPDGSVEIVAKGDPERISVFLEKVKQGPISASVDRIEVTDVDPSRVTYRDFRIKF